MVRTRYRYMPNDFVLVLDILATHFAPKNKGKLIYDSRTTGNDCYEYQVPGRWSSTHLRR